MYKIIIIIGEIRSKSFVHETKRGHTITTKTSCRKMCVWFNYGVERDFYVHKIKM